MWGVDCSYYGDNYLPDSASMLACCKEVSVGGIFFAICALSFKSEEGVVSKFPEFCLLYVTVKGFPAI